MSGCDLGRLDPQDGSGSLVGRQIQESIRPLPHVSDSLLQLGQQRLVPTALRGSGRADLGAGGDGEEDRRDGEERTAQLYEHLLWSFQAAATCSVPRPATQALET